MKMKSFYLSLCLSPLISPFQIQANDANLESYLKEYKPEVYNSLSDQGTNILGMEYEARASSTQYSKSSDSVLAFKPIAPSSARKICESSNGFFLENNYIATCVTQDGTFGNSSNELGMTFNSSGTGTVSQPDFLRPGSPHEYFSIQWDGGLHTNNNSYSSSPQIPTGVKPLYRYNTATHEGGVIAYSNLTYTPNPKLPKQYQALDIEQKYSLDPDAREIVIRTEVRNTGNLAIKNVKMARGLDPDQDISSSSSSTFSTLNYKGYSFYYPAPARTLHVSPENIVLNEGINSRLWVALYSIDPVKHDTCISSSWTVNPSDILNQTCGLSTQPIYDESRKLLKPNYSDSTINIAFDLGTLSPGQSKVFSYRYMFGLVSKGRSLEDPIDTLPIDMIDSPLIK